jgi:GGDEF domain-containing protein
MTYLALVDVPGIKDYVFGTDRLVQIRGASALLDQWNRFLMREFLADRLGTEQGRVVEVFAGGGAGEFLLEATPGEAVAALEALTAHLRLASHGGLCPVWGLASYDGADYGGARDRAFRDLRVRKETPAIRGSLLHTGYLRECDACSGPAAGGKTYGGELRLLCAACAAKLDEGRERGHFLEFGASQGWNEAESNARRPRDFTEIADRSPTGHTALVYADGNGMGRLIRAIREQAHFKTFSATVAESLKAACHEALATHCRPRPGPEGIGMVPADILLLGGDDLLVYLAADAALPFALAAARGFTDQTQKALAAEPSLRDLLQGQGLTLSLGIAIGKSHTPFAILLEQAEELLKSAKQAGGAHGTGSCVPPSYLDYHFTSYFNQLRVADCRDLHLRLAAVKPLRLTAKPYSLEEAQALWDQACDLARTDIPRSRLHAMGIAPSRGKMNATLDCLSILGRTRDGDHRRLLRETLGRFGGDPLTLPWRDEGNTFSTQLVDLLELVELAAT